MILVAVAAPYLAGAVYAEPEPDPKPEAPQEETPPPREVPMFGLNLHELYAGFEGDFEHRRIRSTAPRRRDATQTNRNFRFAELMGMTLGGHLYDPELLEYRAAMEFGLLQTGFRERVDEFKLGDRSSGMLMRYDLSADVLRSKPISFNVYARRQDDRVPRRFIPSLRERQTEAGVSMLAIKGPTTTEVSMSWQDIERTGNRFREDNETLELSRWRVDHTWEIDEDHRLRLFYDHERMKNVYQGTDLRFSNQRDEVRVEHDFAFGEDKKHRMDTFFRFNVEKGDLARDEIELVPRLTLQLTEKLRTMFRYGWYEFDQGALNVSQHKFDLQALYQATPDLRITLDGFGLYENVDQDVDTVEFGGRTDVGYRRDTEWGELLVNAAFGFDRSQTRGDAGRRFARSEGHQLSEVRPVFLRERGVVPGSVLAHDGRRTRFYVHGVDYAVIIVGDRAMVRRLPRGRIPEQEFVYFDYDYVIPARARIDAYRTDFLIEHRFDFGLTPYYHLEGRAENIRSSPATPRFRDNTFRHRMGTRYEKDRYRVGAEYEIFDDATLPYDAFHLTGQWNAIQAPAHSLDLMGELSRYLFKASNDHRRVWWLDLGLRDNLRLTRHLSLISGAGYRWQHDSVAGTTNAMDLTCGIQFVRGDLRVDLTVEYDLLNIRDNREGGLGVFLNVRRDLTHLLPDRRTP